MELRSGNKAPGKQEGAVSPFPKNSIKSHLLTYCKRWNLCFFDIFVSMGHSSFIFCILKYISNYCYITGKWHNYFHNDLIYRFISFRARRDYYDLQSCGQSHLPDDSMLQAQRFWPSDDPSSQREALSEPESTICWRIHITCRRPIAVWGAWQLSPAVPRAPLWPAPSSFSFTTALLIPGQKSCFSHFLAKAWNSFRGRLGRGLAVALIQLAAAIGPGACTGSPPHPVHHLPHPHRPEPVTSRAARSGITASARIPDRFLSFPFP